MPNCPACGEGISDGIEFCPICGVSLIAEASHAGIPWTKPEDVDVKSHPALGDKQGFSSDHPGIVVVAFADGRVRTIRQDIDAQTLQALFTCDGGEKIRDGDF